MYYHRYEEEFEIPENFENYLEKDRSLAKRRRLNVTKALRKRNICKKAYPVIPEWYNNLHQYSKNKIHCSCAMCSFNNKRKQRLGIPKCVSIQDIKRLIDMDQQIKEFG